MKRSSTTALRVKQKLRNGELLVPGDQWPIFLYQGSVYNEDDPWKGLLRSTLLVSVRIPLVAIILHLSS